jgi:lipopolysaccharide transport system ATP-binding protein
MVMDVIRVENLCKLYDLGQVGTGTLSKDINRWWAKVLGMEDPYSKIAHSNDRTIKASKNESVWALEDISFSLNKGEVMGIIGRNGAGKSTLLKIISRITTPTKGEVKLRGRIASLLEVGTGFNLELTGRENIFLNGAILGMTKAEIKSKLDEIVDFSGVEKYIDTPVKRYSSGMYVRLAFAVAAHLESEILIVDEVLAVGDAEFQNKAIGRLKDISAGNIKTVIFVSHDLSAVSRLCTQAILLKNGCIEKKGSVNQVLSYYLKSKLKNPLYENPVKSGGTYIDSIIVTDTKGQLKSYFTIDEKIIVSFKIKISDQDKRYSLFVCILDSRKRRVFSCETTHLRDNIELVLNERNLVRGEYSLLAFINIPRVGPIHLVDDVCDFEIIDNSSFLAKHGDYDYGLVFGSYQWN